MAVFADASDIMEFQDRHAGDDRFGSIWVSYDDGYRVHVRYLETSFDDNVKGLQQRLGRPIQRATGGASFQTLIAARAAVEDAVVVASVTFSSGSARRLTSGGIEFGERRYGIGDGIAGYAL